MPFVFAVLGVLLLVIAIQGTQAEAFAMLRKEFSGSKSFVVFASAIVILGALAYIRPIRPIAFGMIGLVLLAMFLKNGNTFIAGLQNSIRNPVAPNATTGSASGDTNNALIGGSSPFSVPATAYPTVTTPQGQQIMVPPIQTPWAPGAI